MAWPQRRCIQNGKHGGGARIFFGWISKRSNHSGGTRKEATLCGQSENEICESRRNRKSSMDDGNNRRQTAT
jgi:hypothetical protein